MNCLLKCLLFPGSPGGDPNDKGSDIGNDISVDNIKEEKAGNGNQNPANPGQILHPHGSPIMDQMNKSRELDGKKLFGLIAALLQYKKRYLLSIYLTESLFILVLYLIFFTKGQLTS